MKRLSNSFLVPVWIAATLFAALPAYAADSADGHGAQPAKTAQPMRLSDWLLAHPAANARYREGLSWHVPSEVPRQKALRKRVLRTLDRLHGKSRKQRRMIRGLHKLIANMPATGRVPVVNADPRWLQAHPDHNPVIEPGESVVVPQRPTTVTVLGASSMVCKVNHQAGHHLLDYVTACSLGAPKVDWAWIVQPDGKIQRFGTADWNLTSQAGVPPGAWIWAPARDSGWPATFSADLVRFLATQGPAPDNTLVNPIWSLPKTHTPLSFGEPHAVRPTANDWGEIGLLQTPTARMRPAGEVSFSFGRVDPYTNMNLFLQPFDWLEGGFRYTRIANRLYGPVSFSGQQRYKDKSLDLKLRLLNESDSLPAVAVGWRDLAGTGLFSGEYLVASKRTGDFDWSMGMGWGYLGGRGNLKNPFSLLGQRFSTRQGATDPTGGQFTPKSYFTGPVSLFGGVQYQTPWTPLKLKLEYDGNNYQHDPLGNVLKQSLPFNVGAVYTPIDGLDLNLGFERGNTVMFGANIHAPYNKAYMPKFFDPPPVAVAAKRPKRAPDWKKTAADFTRQTGWKVKRIARHGRELRVTLDSADGTYWRQRLDRGVAVLHRDAPADIDTFTLDYLDHGMNVAEYRVNRDAWMRSHTEPLPPSDLFDPVMAQAPMQEQAQETDFAGHNSPFENSFGPGLNYNLDGPDNFILYQVYLEDTAKFHLNDSTWLQGSVRLGLIDNYDKFHLNSNSVLPHVRTDIRQYVTTSKVRMPTLYMAHTGKLSDNTFYSVYGGYLERMFAGVGGEWLYRPFESPLAFGIDVNEVRKRGFRQDLSLLTYKTTTGHATMYWDTGWQNTQLNLSVGRYLAGDTGASIQATRTFKNGATMSAGFTKTNISAAQFGEGSFDKWIAFSIPLDAILAKSTPGNAMVSWHPLIRDGGAKLIRPFYLYDLTKARDKRTLQYEPGKPPNDTVIPEQRHDAWTPPDPGIEPYLSTPAKVPLKRWKADDQPYRWRLQAALYRQKFRDIGIRLEDDDATLAIRLSNKAIHPISRAVGRAARTAVLMAPQEISHIRITFLAPIPLIGITPRPVVVYDFTDRNALKRYLDGVENEAALADTVKVQYLHRDARENDPLALLGDSTPARAATPRHFVRHSLHRVKNDLVNTYHLARHKNWLADVAIGSGLLLASTTLDRTGDSFATRHANSTKLKDFNKIGNTLVPLVTGAGAVMAALSDDPLLSRAGYASMEAGGIALGLALGTKYAVGRSRPFTGRGPHSFHPFNGSSSNNNDSFPSGHTIMVWSMLTPFAEAYHQPWLYGVAALTNLSRIGGRHHWVSDTVAGSLLGYAIGKLTWEASAHDSPYIPSVATNGRDVMLTWRHTY